MSDEANFGTASAAGLVNLGAASIAHNKQLLAEEVDSVSNTQRQRRDIHDNEVHLSPTHAALVGEQAVITATEPTKQQPEMKAEGKPITQKNGTEGIGLFLLSKMFYEPPKSIVPANSGYSISANQMIVDIPKETSRNPRPADFSDPLILYQARGAVPTAIFDIEPTTMPCEIVEVKLTSVRRAFVPKITPFGAWIQSTISSQKDQTSAIRGILPQSPFNDQSSAPILLWNAYAGAAEIYHDESPIIRGLCLLQCLMPLEWYHAKSQITTNLQFHTDHIEYRGVIWTAQSEYNTMIPTANSTCVLTVMTAQQYCEAKFRKGTSFSDSIIVPALFQWLRQQWFVAYMMLFTTTKWWNHAVLVHGQVRDSRNVAGEPAIADPFYFSAMPKGCTVVIDGPYKKILVVVTDMALNQPLPRQTEIGGLFNLDENDRYTQMARLFYQYLGRANGIPVGNRIQCGHVRTALEHMKLHLADPSSFQRMMAYASVLLGSFTLGFSCSTNPETAQAQWVNGPACYNINRADANNQIDGWQVDDWAGDDAHHQSKRFIWRDWRVNCFGMLTHSRVNVRSAREDDPRPSLSSFGHIVGSYSITEMAGDIRLLMLMGAFENYVNLHGTSTSMTDYELMNSIYGHSALIGGLTNLALSEYGLSIFDVNKLSTYFKRPARGTVQWLNVIKLMTDTFINVDEDISLSYYLTDDAITNVQTITGIADRPYDNWFSLFLPYWFIFGITKKFGVTLPFITRGTDNIPGMVPDQDDLDDYGFAELYDCTVGVSNWSDYNTLISTIKYDVNNKNLSAERRFAIYLPTRNLNDIHTSYIGWWTYGTDGEWITRELRRARGGATLSPRPETVSAGVVDLLMVARPDSRVHWFKIPTRMYVSFGAHHKRDVPRTMITSDLTIPDPFLEWLTKGVLNVLPFVATGDALGAAAVGTMYVLETGWDKLKEFFLKLGDVEEVVDEYNLSQEIN